jgi:CHAP domain
VRLLAAGLVAVFGLSLAPLLAAAVPASTSPGPAPEAAPVSGRISPDTARPLFADVPAGGYPDHFPFGQCTWWAAFNVRVTWWGDAWTWVAGARAAGRVVGAAPAVHAIVVYAPSASYSAWGHVALVVGAGPGGFQVSEMNYADGGRGTGVVDERESPWPDPLVEGFVLPE